MTSRPAPTSSRVWVTCLVPRDRHPVHHRLSRLLGVVVVAAGELDEDARLLPDRPGVVARREQHDVTSGEVLLATVTDDDPERSLLDQRPRGADRRVPCRRTP